MAVDTEAKRRSAIHFLLPILGLGEPDGSIDQADRQETVWSYRGILATAPVAAFKIVATAMKSKFSAVALGDKFVASGMRSKFSKAEEG